MHLNHPMLAELLRFWEGARAGREMPDWQETDRTTLWQWMGNLNVVEIIDGGHDCLCRLHGTKLTAIASHDATGQLYSNLPDIDPGPVIEEYRAVYLARRPAATVRRPMSTRRNFIELEKLMLPYTNGGNDCGIVLTGIYEIGRQSVAWKAHRLLSDEAVV